MEARTHASLLVRLRDPSDEAAWREFDAQYRELILRYCNARGLQRADAEDVRQIVMMNLAKGLPHFEYSPEKGRFRAYLGRSVRHAISRFLNRAHSRPDRGRSAPDMDVNAPAHGSQSDPSQADEAWEQEWHRHHYRLAARTLRGEGESRDLAVFDRLLAGATAGQVAAEMGLSSDAVHKIKQRTGRRLRALIATQIREEDKHCERQLERGMELGKLSG